MAEKSSGKSKKNDADEAGVLSSLPATRPARMSRRARAGDDPKGPPKPAAPKPKPRTAAKPKAKTAAAKAKPKTAAAAKPKPKSPAAGRPKLSAVGAARSADKPKPVRAGSPALKEPARKAADKRDEIDELPAKNQSGAELAATVVKAAGELAQIGATLGGQVLKRAVRRIPKP